MTQRDTERPKDKCAHTGPAPGNAQKRPEVGIRTDGKIWLPLSSWEEIDLSILNNSLSIFHNHFGAQILKNVASQVHNSTFS